MTEEKIFTKGIPRTKQPVNLSYIEIWTYAIVFIGGYSYSFYTVFVFSSEKGRYLTKSSLEDGWSIIGRKRDRSDFEWQLWKELFFTLWPFYVGHIILGKMCRYWNYEKRQVVLMVYSFAAVGFCLTYKMLIYLTLVCLTIVVLAYITRSIIVVWLASLGHIFSIQFTVKYPDSYMSMKTHWLCNGEQWCTKLAVHTSGYLLMRYISFSHDLINHLNSTIRDKELVTENMKETNGFSQDHEDLEKYHFVIHSPVRPWTKGTVVLLVKDNLRVLFWTLFMEVILHYFYFYSIQLHHRVLWKVSYWTLAGVSYLVAHFFQVKYVSLFGVPINIAKLDGLTPFGTPRCGIYVYKFSEMWRNFDIGLHAFVTRHIYFPLGGSKQGLVRQLVATLICYAFVFVWHGYAAHLFVWAALNFLSIVIEAVTKSISTWPTFVSWEDKYVPPRWGRRLRALFWTPVLMMNYLSSFIFFSGATFGKICVHRFLIEGFPVTYLTAGVVLFSQIQISMEYSNYRERRKKPKVD